MEKKEQETLYLTRDSIAKMIREKPEWLIKAIRAIADRMVPPDSLDEIAKGAKRVGKFGFDGYDATYFKYVLRWTVEHPEIGISGVHVIKCQSRLLQNKYLDQLIEIAKENAAKS